MDRIGHKLGNKYELVEHLGQGGMAEVYKAHQSGVERFVAVKILHRHLSSDSDFLERFRREAKAMGQLQHRHIVGVIECDTQANEPYIVLQYVPGGTVREYIKEKGTLPPIEALRITAQVANALAEAHQKGLIHRDIKPTNIMFMDERKNDVVLSDFGLARLVDSKTLVNLTTTGMIPGTIPYMAREVIQSESADQRSDIYSLGVVLYEMLTGSTPYSADSAYGIMVKQIQDESFPRPSQKNPDVPQVVDELVLKALDKDPDQRFQSAEEFFHAIEKTLGVFNGGVPQDPSTDKVPHPENRIIVLIKNMLKSISTAEKWRPFVAVVAGVVLAALVTVTLLTVIVEPPPTETPILVDESTDPVATSPSQAPIPTVAPTGTVEPTETEVPPPPPPNAEPVAVLRFTDNGAGQVSGVTLQLDQADSRAEGQNYELWLVDSGDPNNKWHVGAVENGQTDYITPDNSLAHYDEVHITQGTDGEQILFSGRLDAEFLDQLRALMIAEHSQGFLPKAIEQAQVANQQVSALQDALARNDLVQAKRYIEQIVNVLEGEGGQNYGDLNDDGLTENPGNGFGVKKYLRGVQGQTERVLDTVELTPELQSNAQQVMALSANGESAANQAIDLALQLLQAEQVDDNTRSLANKFEWYLHELLEGPDEETPGILEAYKYGLKMAEISIYPF